MGVDGGEPPGRGRRGWAGEGLQSSAVSRALSHPAGTRDWAALRTSLSPGFIRAPATALEVNSPGAHAPQGERPQRSAVTYQQPASAAAGEIMRRMAAPRAPRPAEPPLQFTTQTDRLSEGGSQ